MRYWNIRYGCYKSYCLVTNFNPCAIFNLWLSGGLNIHHQGQIYMNKVSYVLNFLQDSDQYKNLGIIIEEMNIIQGDIIL